MAKGKYRDNTTTNSKVSQSSNGNFKNSETFASEYDINDTPPNARILLTKGYIQDEINNFSGATISTRGRYMTQRERAHSNERPLYLFIQSHAKRNVDLALEKINEIIMSEQKNAERPSRFTNALPPLMSLHSPAPSVEKICVGIENPPVGFDLRNRIIGNAGANLLYIRTETGANVTLRGRGSRYLESSGMESQEPLHLHIEHPKPEGLQIAKQLAINLIQTMQSEFQSYIQQQPPPPPASVQSQQLVEQRIPQATQFQTMNIGAIGQPNVVTIQHQDLIQHPQSSVVTLPAAILTATVPNNPEQGISVPPPGVHIPGHSGPLVQSQPQELRTTFIPPPPMGQVQLIGPPPMGQVQYQIHTSQPLQIQGIQVPTVSQQTTTQISNPVTQMYVMSQPPPPPPPPQNNNSSNSVNNNDGVPVSGTVSYVYTQTRPATPSSIDANLNQAPPSINVSQPPPSLLHLHFPPPSLNNEQNSTPGNPSHTYQIQYQQAAATGGGNGQFVLQEQENLHVLPPPPPQFHLQVPPPGTNAPGNFMIQNQTQGRSPVARQQDGDNAMPQPVPPPQMVPPPAGNGNAMQGNQGPPPLQSAPWLYQAQASSGQMQIPPTSIAMHPTVPPPQIQYHPQQLQYHNGHPQVHYSIQSNEQKLIGAGATEMEQQKFHGVKRRFSDVESNQEPFGYHFGPHPHPHPHPPHPHSHPHPPHQPQRHGNGECTERQVQRALSHGPAKGARSQQQSDRKKSLLPATQHPANEGDGSAGSHWQGSNPSLRNFKEHGVPDRESLMYTAPPPPPPPLPPPPATNFPPPQIRPRGQIEGPPAGGPMNPGGTAIQQRINEINQMYSVKTPTIGSLQNMTYPPPSTGPPSLLHPQHHFPQHQHQHQHQHQQPPQHQQQHPHHPQHPHPHQQQQQQQQHQLHHQPPTTCPQWMN